MKLTPEQIRMFKETAIDIANRPSPTLNDLSPGGIIPPTFDPSLEFSHYDDDQPVFRKRQS